MPVPAVALIIWAERAYKVYSVYEAAALAKETAEMLADIARRREEVKTVLRETIGELSKEIDVKSSTYAEVDKGGNMTVFRQAKEGTTFKEYICRKIPFRPAISVVCNLALKSPIKVPRRVRRKIPGDVVETTTEMALKQTTASLIFETIDEVLDWKSPLKAEPNYKSESREAYLDENIKTKPKRSSKVFPFWPRPRGSLACDLVIVEYRQQPCDVPNVFAAVEIKFPNDWVKEDQMNKYVKLMGNDSEKVALLRVPEDCVGTDRSKEAVQPATNKGIGGKR